MKSGREITPSSGFSTPIPIQNVSTSELPPITTFIYSATTPENTPLAYRASTSANSNPMISPAFVEANYEILESLLREQRRLIHNEDLRTELGYFSEDYDILYHVDGSDFVENYGNLWDKISAYDCYANIMCRMIVWIGGVRLSKYLCGYWIGGLRLFQYLCGYWIGGVRLSQHLCGYWIGWGVTYDEERQMEPRPEQNRETTPPLRMRSPRVRSGPSELGARENESQAMSLPSLLAARLGRSENGQALQSSSTFVY
nr:reverse transcriptase domain-containing protein [Tanacetum cinerariifolium]